MFKKLMESVFVVIIALVILPSVIATVIHTIGPIVATFAVIAASLGAYRALERRRPSARSHRTGGGSERTPIMPHEEE